MKLEDLLILVLGIWLALLTIWTAKAQSSYRKLTKGTGGGNLNKILEDVLQREGFLEKQIREISAKEQDTQNKARGYFQKHAVLRFNPFEDAGGDQSFTVALLDANDNGIVISSLHARGGTRVYAKGVVEGKPATHQFSKEEKEAVEKAARSALQNKK